MRRWMTSTASSPTQHAQHLGLLNMATTLYRWECSWEWWRRALYWSLTELYIFVLKLYFFYLTAFASNRQWIQYNNESVVSDRHFDSPPLSKKSVQLLGWIFKYCFCALANFLFPFLFTPICLQLELHCFSVCAACSPLQRQNTKDLTFENFRQMEGGWEHTAV